MAKLSAINKNNRRMKLSDKYYSKRKKLKKIIMNKKLPLEERFKAQQKLSKLPRNSAKTRVMNRCQITGRPHGVYRKLKISRIALRKLSLEGKIPGMIKVTGMDKIGTPSPINRCLVLISSSFLRNIHSTNNFNAYITTKITGIQIAPDANAIKSPSSIEMIITQ